MRKSGHMLRSRRIQTVVIVGLRDQQAVGLVARRKSLEVSMMKKIAIVFACAATRAAVGPRFGGADVALLASDNHVLVSTMPSRAHVMIRPAPSGAPPRSIDEPRRHERAARHGRWHLR
jgi:hypothetical protein